MTEMKNQSLRMCDKDLLKKIETIMPLAFAV